MFNWFKRKRKDSLILRLWNIDEVPGFEKIQNPDSVQYTNADSSRVIYFSVLTVSGKGPSLLPSFSAQEPKITADANGWQLKGTKQSDKHLLVCVISVTQEEDVFWAKAFFESIKSE